jgi:hypothetical protein
MRDDDCTYCSKSEELETDIDIDTTSKIHRETVCGSNYHQQEERRMLGGGEHD